LICKLCCPAAAVRLDMDFDLDWDFRWERSNHPSLTWKSVLSSCQPRIPTHTDTNVLKRDGIRKSKPPLHNNVESQRHTNVNKSFWLALWSSGSFFFFFFGHWSGVKCYIDDCAVTKRYNSGSAKQQQQDFFFLVFFFPSILDTRERTYNSSLSRFVIAAGLRYQRHLEPSDTNVGAAAAGSHSIK
jgi:hypothetical protein